MTGPKPSPVWQDLSSHALYQAEILEMIQHCSHLIGVRGRIAVVFTRYELANDRIEIPSFGQDLADQEVTCRIQEVGLARGPMKRDKVLIEKSPDDLVR